MTKEKQYIEAEISSEISNYGGGHTKYGHIYIKFYSYENKNDPENKRLYTDSLPVHTDGLVISCQLDSDNNANKGAYAWRCGYRDSDITFNNMDAFVRTLKKINSGMKKIEDELGSVGDFADFAMRCFKSIGVNSYKFRSVYDERTKDISHVKYRISDMLRTLQDDLTGGK